MSLRMADIFANARARARTLNISHMCECTNLVLHISLARFQKMLLTTSQTVDSFVPCQSDRKVLDEEPATINLLFMFPNMSSKRARRGSSGIWFVCDEIKLIFFDKDQNLKKIGGIKARTGKR